MSESRPKIYALKMLSSLAFPLLRSFSLFLMTLLIILMLIWWLCSTQPCTYLLLIFFSFVQCTVWGLVEFFLYSRPPITMFALFFVLSS